MTTPRARARARTMDDILRIGREHLATHGAAALSLRAVARDLGVVSSAIYRYVAGRDELLTLLVIDAYDDLGDAVDRAVDAVEPDDHRAQFHALCRAVRAWALDESARFGLLYGAPVPGYHAPAERTTTPGTRVITRLARLLDAAHEAGELTGAESDGDAIPAALVADLDAIRQEFDLTAPAGVLARGLYVWPTLFGIVGFEVFGQYGPETFRSTEVLFEHHLELLSRTAGFGTTHPRKR